MKFLKSLNRTRHEKNIHSKTKDKNQIADQTVHILKEATDSKDSQSKKSYSCKECDKTYLSRYSLNTHQRIHEEKKYSCNFCTKKFHYLHHLQYHQKTHTGEKPFPCHLCGYSANHSSNLKMDDKKSFLTLTTFNFAAL